MQVINGDQVSEFTLAHSIFVGATCWPAHKLCALTRPAVLILWFMQKKVLRGDSIFHPITRQLVDPTLFLVRGRSVVVIVLTVLVVGLHFRRDRSPVTQIFHLVFFSRTFERPSR